MTPAEITAIEACAVELEEIANAELQEGSAPEPERERLKRLVTELRAMTERHA